MDNIYIRRDAHNSTGHPRLVIESKRPDLWGVPLYNVYPPSDNGPYLVAHLWGRQAQYQLSKAQVYALIRREEAFPELHRF